MLLTSVHEEGADRVYLTRFGSVTCYFTDAEGGGMQLHIEPGLFAYPPEYERNRDAVRVAVLETAAGRLGVAPDEVLQQPLKSLKAVADPDLPEHYRFAKRSKNRTQSFR